LRRRKRASGNGAAARFNGGGVAWRGGGGRLNICKTIIEHQSTIAKYENNGESRAAAENGVISRGGIRRSQQR
jgi:hypothetical protein